MNKMPNKLTDKEIVKALGRLSCKTLNDCKLITDAIDLINRQQAEIEKLNPLEKFAEFNSRIRVEDMLVCASSIGEWLEFCDNLKAKAQKEFAYELMQIPHIVVYKREIYDLLKEKVGDDGV